MATLVWSTSPFIELQEQLSSPDPSDESLQDAIKDRLEDLKNLLKAPPKSDASRKSVSSGKLKIEDVEYSINSEFITEACVLADELSIDENIAAEYLKYGADYQAQLDRSPYQCAIVLFHMRRAFILDIVRIILDNAMNGELSHQQMFIDFSKELATKDFRTSLVNGFTDLRSTLRSLEEKATSGHFLGRDLDESFVSNIKYRHDAILKELDALAQIVALLCQLRFIDGDDLKLLLEGAAALEKYDQVLVLYVACIIFGFESICSSADMSDSGVKKTFDQALSINVYIADKRRKALTTLPYFHAAIELWWYVYFSGLCTQVRDIVNSTKIDYDTDIFKPAITAATTSGGLEFMMVLASDMSIDDGFSTTQASLKSSLVKTLLPVSGKQDPLGQVVPSRPLELEVYYDMSSTFDKKFLDSLRNLVDALISNMPDLLKELRLREEELLFDDEASEDHDGSQREDDIDPSEPELERFFMFVSFVYFGRPDSATAFWSDPEGNLYGFLVWASQCQSPLMIATYCNMLASLATGEQCGLEAHRFMKDEDFSSSGAIAGDRKTYRMSWDYIFEAFAYYISQLQNFNSEQTMFASSATARSLITIADLPELDDDDCLILTGYLHLLQQVATWSPSARADLVGTAGSVNAYELLFSLLRCRTTLTGSIFNAIRAFSVDATKPVRDAIWISLDAWMLHSPVVVSRTPPGLSSTPGGLQHISFRERFTILLTSVQDILAFVMLIECLTRIPVGGTINDLPFPESLGATYRAPSGIRPYIDFIAGDIFYSTTAVTFSPNQRLMLQISCLQFMHNCIENFNIDLIALASISSGKDSGSGGVNIEQAIQPAGLRNYIRVHPCVWTMEKLFEERIYLVIFGIVALGIDKITEPGPYRSRSVDVVRLALKVMYRILMIKDVYSDVLEPTSRADDGPTELSGSGGKAVRFPASSKTLMGMRSFEDAILFNIYVVTHIALYVNSEQVSVASLAIKILDRIARAPQFLNLDYDIPAAGSYANGIIPEIAGKSSFEGNLSGGRIGVNRLLSALDSVEESRRIVFGFITQLERPNTQYATSDENLELTDNEIDNLKLQILEFISRNLSSAEVLSHSGKSDLSALDADSSSLSDVPTISHFLLGFKIEDGSTATSTAVLQHNTEKGGVDSPISLFRTVVNLLEVAVTNASISDTFSSKSSACSRAAAEIIYKLCAAKISSLVTLSLLRLPDFDFFSTRVSMESLISVGSTKWETCTFKDMLSLQSTTDDYDIEHASEEPPASFIPSDQDKERATESLLQFLAARTFLLEYLAVELHSVSDPATSVFEKYVQQLITVRGTESTATKADWSSMFACETAKLLELLDFLELDIEKLAARWGVSQSLGKIQDLIVKDAKGSADDSLVVNDLAIFEGLRFDDICLYSLPPLAAATPGSLDSLAPTEALYDTGRIRELLELKIREHLYSGRLQLPLRESIVQTVDKIVAAAKRFNAVVCLRRAQSQCLAAWCRLLRIILVDTNSLSSPKSNRFPGRDTMILETMQVLAPKLLHYAHVWESRVAEHLASASVALISAISSYLTLDDGADSAEDEEGAATDISHTVFRVSLVAVQSPYASPSVRADLYTLINIFVCSHPVHRRRKLAQLQHTIQTCANGSSSSDTSLAKENRLLERVATDAVSGEGVTRIMALTVLRAFAAVENITSQYFVLDALVRYNLLLLLVRSVRRIDEELDDENRVSNYEVTAFRAVLVFLTELAQSRTGAAQIIQCGLFNVLQNANYLSVDPDIGISTYSSTSGYISTLPAAGKISWFWPTSERNGDSGQNVYFELVAPTMRLLTCCVLSMGQRNFVVLKLVREVLNKRLLLVRAILRRVVSRDVTKGLNDNGNWADEEDEAIVESGRLVVLLSTLTESVDNPQI